MKTIIVGASGYIGKLLYAQVAKYFIVHGTTVGNDERNVREYIRREGKEGRRVDQIKMFE